MNDGVILQYSVPKPRKIFWPITGANDTNKWGDQNQQLNRSLSADYSLSYCIMPSD